MADLLNIGISGLKVHQTALAVTGHNITNVNTEGYSRQDINVVSQTPQFLGGIWVGSGAQIDDVRRVYDEFLVDQVRKDTSTFEGLDSLTLNAEQIDSLMADPGTGLQPGLERFFGSLQAAIDDPSSIPARQVVISESQGLVDRFKTINQRLVDHNATLNGQMEAMVGKVNAFAEAIAELNKQILFASSSSQGNKPNDLLDKRDLALKGLSELVGTTVVEQDGNSINVSIGSGQTLVVGTTIQKIEVITGSGDPQRKSIVLTQNGVELDITREISGGQLSGLLDFREQVLDPSINQLGRISIGMQQFINEQHQRGIDIDGQPGELFFEDLNAVDIAQRRVVGSDENAKPHDRQVAVYITDAASLTDSDYRVEFTGPNDVTFKVIRLDDGAEVLKTGITTDFPDTFEIDGFTLSFEAGNYKAGDQFYLMPTRTGAKDIELNLELPQQIALAVPIMTNASLGNRGSGDISSGEVFDINTQAFEIPGQINPPLLIKFSSATSYDVLDNSDPAHPIPLFPSLMNQQYIPGITNNLLPTDNTVLAVTSLGGYVPSSASYQDWRLAPIVVGNGLFPGRITISEPDAITGNTLQRPEIFIPADTPAIETARLLSLEKGINASARTTVELKDFVAGVYLTNSPFPDEPVKLYLNGVELTDVLAVSQLKYDTPYPTEVPEPLTPDFVADRINANFDFRAQGIVARSDGESVQIIAINGEDLAFEIDGELGDGFKFSNGDDIYLRPTGKSLPSPLTEFDGFDFSQDGPFNFEFDIPGQGTFAIQLTGNHATGAGILNEIRTKIEDTTYFFNGDIDVDIDNKGNITFQTRLDVFGNGDWGSYKVTMGGQVKVALDEGLTMSAAPNLSNLFEEEPSHDPVYLGYEITMTGIPSDGDEYEVNFNNDAVSDNRNGNFLSNLQNVEIIEDDMTLSEGYGRMVEEVGSITARAQINKESAKTLLDHSEASVQSVSGVNLDEEAAKLIQYELGYNASAQVISVARDIFSTLIGIFR
ncbi:MAG: flagellar hook-associated protein FlgK [Bermanella sp.]